MTGIKEKFMTYKEMAVKKFQNRTAKQDGGNKKDLISKGKSFFGEVFTQKNENEKEEASFLSKINGFIKAQESSGKRATGAGNFAYNPFLGQNRGDSNDFQSSLNIRPFMPVIESSAERERAPLKWNEPVNIAGDKDSPEFRDNRIHLLRNSPQVNKTSGDKGKANGKDLCGAASVTNALIMDCKDKKTAEKNGEALEKVCKDFEKKNKLFLPPHEKEAIENLKKGKLSRKDVENLQQVMYKLSQSTGGHGNGGTNAVGMANMVTMLRAKGGFSGDSNVRFHNTKHPEGGVHWTTSVDGVHIDTMPTSKSTKSLIRGGTPSKVERQYGGDKWISEVSFYGNSDVTVEGENSSGKYRSYTIKQDKYNNMDMTEVNVQDDIVNQEKYMRRKAAYDRWHTESQQ